MTTDDDSPRLDFFRATPPGMSDAPPLASSLQSFETCLFLIALGRFPSALITCATAWESALKAKLKIQPNERVTSEKMLNEIRTRYASLRLFDGHKLDEFRRTRNRLIHFGFSPKDDQRCAMLLLETGLPFLSLCYRELFDFYLDWTDIRSDVMEFNALSPEEMAKCGLVPEMAEQVRYVSEIYRYARQGVDLDYVACFATLIHYIRLKLKESARAKSEWGIFETAEGQGIQFSQEQKTKKELERVYVHSWTFDCPICAGIESLVVELEFSGDDVATDRCACVQCGFVVGKGVAYISQILLMEEIPKKRATILKEFGLERDL